MFSASAGTAVGIRLFFRRDLDWAEAPWGQAPALANSNDRDPAPRRRSRARSSQRALANRSNAAFPSTNATRKQRLQLAIASSSPRSAYKSRRTLADRSREHEGGATSQRGAAIARTLSELREFCAVPALAGESQTTRPGVA